MHTTPSPRVVGSFRSRLPNCLRRSGGFCRFKTAAKRRANRMARRYWAQLLTRDGEEFELQLPAAKATTDWDLF